MKIILAGVATILHLESLIQILNTNNINYSLIENKILFKKIPKKYNKQVIKTNELPLGSCLIIPLNEYWVSKIILLKQKNTNIGVSINALYASRSKLKMSKLLFSKGIKSLVRFPLDNISNLKSKKIVIRPDCAYSGYGILIVKKNDFISVEHSYNVVIDNIPKSMNKILGVTKHKLICEEFLDGQEYSVDVFKNRDSITIIRLSKKKVVYKNNIPCVIGYLQIKITNKFSKTIKNWINAIFEKDDISFAQFDFIENKNKELVPIDFSCRVGSGVSDLILNSAKLNLYACCIVNIVHKKKYDLTYNENWAQFNFNLDIEGEISEIDISWPSDHILLLKRNKGDLINKKHIGSAGNRILEIIELLDSSELFDQRCEMLNNRINIEII